MAGCENKSLKDKVGDIIHQGVVGFSLSMAYELGILEVLVLTDTPMTSQEVADAKQLKERYVRELLKSLSCANIVEVERVGDVYYYTIDKEKGSIFIGDSMPYLGFLASLSVRYEPMMKCIKKDGPYGLPYNETLTSMMTVNQVSSARSSIEISIMLDNVPGLKEKLETGIYVIELGSGMGSLISRMAQLFPASSFTASEYSSLNLEKGREALSALNLPNLTMIQLDALNIPEDMYGKYDFAMTNDVIHVLPDPQRGLEQIRRLLRPGCYYAMIEIGLEDDVIQNIKTPGADMVYTISAFHCVPQAYQDSNSVALGAGWGKGTAIRYSENAGYKVVSQHQHLDIFVVFVLQVL